MGELGEFFFQVIEEGKASGIVNFRNEKNISENPENNGSPQAPIAG